MAQRDFHHIQRDLSHSRHGPVNDQPPPDSLAAAEAAATSLARSANIDLASARQKTATRHGHPDWDALRNHFLFQPGLAPDAIGVAYDEIAERWQDGTFDSTRGIALHERALELTAKSDPVTGAALDVGCGCSSRVSNLLRQHNLVVVGVDVSPRMLELARIANPGQHFIQADICTWEPPATYDFITAGESIWHVPLGEREGVLSKLMRALAPGGVMLFTGAGTNEPSDFAN